MNFFSAIFLSTILICGVNGLRAQMVSTISEQIDASGGISIGADGKIYVANFGESLNIANGNQVHVFDQNFNHSIFAAGLDGASGNDFGPDGHLYQSNITSDKISRISPEGMVQDFSDLGIDNPVGIVVDETGNVFVANCGSHNIQKLNSEGDSSIVYASGDLFACPNGITLDEDGNIYVSNFNNGDIIKIDTLQVASLFATLPGGNNGHITFCAATQVLYAASHGASQIFRISLDDGEVEVVAGTGVRGNLDGPADQATFSRPNGIRTTVSGDTLFVNSSIPTTNVGLPLNPSVVRMITGLNPTATSVNSGGQGTIIKLFPNPVRNELYMELPHPLKSLSRVWIVDSNFLLKKELNQFSGMTSRVAVDVSHWATGMYFVILEHDRQRWIEKILVY